MAFEQIKLSEREQWAQNLNGNLKGMIPLAEFLAIYFDHEDVDGLDNILACFLSSENKKKFVWESFLHMIRDWCKHENPDTGCLKDFDNAMKSCRRQYKDVNEYITAKAEMTITFLMNEFSHQWTWIDNN